MTRHFAFASLVIAIALAVLGPPACGGDDDDSEGAAGAATACVQSGGKVESTMCCTTTHDFPNLCLVGACGCSLDNSVPTETCRCATGYCFDGKRCVAGK